MTTMLIATSILVLATNPVAVAKGFALNALLLTRFDPAITDALRKDDRALREAKEILTQFDRWYVEQEPKLQSFARLGFVGAYEGRKMACGDHAQSLGEYIISQSDLTYEKFKFRVFNEGLVTHTFLIADWREGDVAINLDSWLFGKEAPRVPVSTVWGDQDVTESFLSESRQRQLTPQFHTLTECRLSP